MGPLEGVEGMGGPTRKTDKHSHPDDNAGDDTTFENDGGYGPERRISPSDDEPLTMEEFLECYGEHAEQKWEAAIREPNDVEKAIDIILATRNENIDSWRGIHRLDETGRGGALHPLDGFIATLLQKIGSGEWDAPGRLRLLPSDYIKIIWPGPVPGEWLKPLWNDMPWRDWTLTNFEAKWKRFMHLEWVQRLKERLEAQQEHGTDQSPRCIGWEDKEKHVLRKCKFNSKSKTSEGRCKRCQIEQDREDAEAPLREKHQRMRADHAKTQERHHITRMTTTLPNGLPDPNARGNRKAQIDALAERTGAGAAPEQVRKQVQQNIKAEEPDHRGAGTAKHRTAQSPEVSEHKPSNETTSPTAAAGGSQSRRRLVQIVSQLVFVISGVLLAAVLICIYMALRMKKKSRHQNDVPTQGSLRFLRRFVRAILDLD